ncbi:MFS transporter [Comamonas thiooxydans]|nr:MFS transporter [Comamonas thiooxydans]
MERGGYYRDCCTCLLPPVQKAFIRQRGSLILKRREFSIGACATILSLPSIALANKYPDRPIKLIVPFAAGSSPDTNMRFFAHEFGKVLGQPLVVENRPGANGITGTIGALGSPKDGYSIMYVNANTLAINPYLFPKQKYQPLRDMTLLGMTSLGANILVTRPTLEVKNVAELIALAKAKPGVLSMGSSGTGTTGHLSGELFKEMAKIDVVHVPYKGSAAAYTDLTAGRVDFMFDNLVSLGTQEKDGRVKVLAVTTAERNGILPHVPTLKESGLKEYEVLSWGGIAAPKGIPEPIVTALREALDKVKQSPTYVDYFKKIGGFMLPSMTEAQLVSFVQAEEKKWSAIIKKSGAANT